MKVHVLIYEGFTEFEVILANYFVKTKGEIVAVGLKEDIIKSFEGFCIKPDIALKDVNLEDVEALIIPGGDPDELFNCKELKEVLVKLNEDKKLIGAICSGVIHLAQAGILDNKRYTSNLNMNDNFILKNSTLINENVSRDENIITARPNGYVDFAIEIAEYLDIFEDENDLRETIENFKYFKL
ncbi:DJ-1/PfpI family protein [Romboutsia weinsteinii]|nr:DJ-1/PfpI family protein [Romboutsia weinsteinii]